MNADLSGWKVAKVVTLYGTFYGAYKFTGTGVDTWDVATVTRMDKIFGSTTSLTTCNKRKVADAWESSSPTRGRTAPPSSPPPTTPTVGE